MPFVIMQVCPVVLRQSVSLLHCEAGGRLVPLMGRNDAGTLIPSTRLTS
jgi:hypothetical protein